MDAAEPPRIVFERPAPCRDAERAEQLLRAALASARAPSAAWTVSMRVEKSGAGLSARGEIVDAAGAPVAHRDLSGSAPGCVGLARAVGVWALLVLDAELERAKSAPPPEPPPEPAPASAPPVQVEPAIVWPAPIPNEKPPPEHDWYLHHDDRRTLEPGIGTFLMSGAGTPQAVAGVSPYFVVEAANGLFLRPALVAGESVMPLASDSDTRALFIATRFDACLRLPGLYAQRRGIQLDVCGGSDLGFVHVGSDRTIPHLSFGPSVDLRGELGGDLAVTLRGVSGVNVLRDSFIDPVGTAIEPPLLAARLELAFSWRMR